MKKLIFVVLAFAATSSAFAAPSVCTVDLKPGVTNVPVRPYKVIDLCLPAGQKVADIASGNADGWLIEANKETGRLMVKINGQGGAAFETNMIVWSDTNQRYEVNLARSFAADAGVKQK